VIFSMTISLSGAGRMQAQLRQAKRSLMLEHYIKSVPASSRVAVIPRSRVKINSERSAKGGNFSLIRIESNFPLTPPASRSW
jgi:hypothetical protein